MERKRKGLISGISVLMCLMFLTFSVPDLFAYPVMGTARDGQEEKAPDFVLKDLQNRKFKLSDHKGKPVLLIFGATWCPYCRDAIPHLKDIYSRYGKKGLVAVNIDIQESRDKVLRFADKYKLPYRVLLDENAEVAQNYGVQGVPMLVLIDKNGMIVCRQCRTVELLLDKMLK